MAPVLPPLLLPHLQRTQRAPVSKMLSEELAEESLVRARGGVIEGCASVALQEAPQGVTRLGG